MRARIYVSFLLQTDRPLFNLEVDKCQTQERWSEGMAGTNIDIGIDIGIGIRAVLVLAPVPAQE